MQNMVITRIVGQSTPPSRELKSGGYNTLEFGLTFWNERVTVMLPVTVKNDSLHFGDALAMTFQRTLRIPDDGKNYPLPPGLGTFPVCKVSDYADRVPKSWVAHGGVFIP